ncbi:MAG: type III-B CRISPR module RAMP protein Cmr6 [Bdellovibrionales bacterium]
MPAQTGIPANGIIQGLVDNPAKFAINTVASSHPGLALDRFLPFSFQTERLRDDPPDWAFWKFDSKDRGPWLRQFAKKVSDTYHQAKTKQNGWYAWAKRYQEMIRAWEKQGDAKCITLRPRWRWIIGLGNQTVLETGITLHHTYGIPYLPGSALKGMTQALVELELESNTQKTKLDQLGQLLLSRGNSDARKCAIEAIFGTQNKAGTQKKAGEIIFLDGIPSPDGDPPKLTVDIMTPHFSKYYSGQRANPLEVEDPTPIPFLVVNGGHYQITVAKRHPTVSNPLLELASELCVSALDEIGIGGKTAKGYGYFV